MEGKLMAVPIYVWNGTAWESTGPTIPASPIKYQASAPSSPSTGDIWVDSDGDVTTGSQQFQRFRFVASGGETTISGADANGAVLAYTAGAELVVLNGSTLVRGQDYTATNGTSITGLSPALVANDVLEVFSFIAFTVANTYTQSQVDGFVTSLGGTSTAWTSFTPSWINITQGNGTVTASYKQIGKTVHLFVKLVWGSTTSASGSMGLTLPVTAKNTGYVVPLWINDSGSSTFTGVAWIYATTQIFFYANKSDSTYTYVANANATVPMTWTTNDELQFVITYEAA